MGQSEEQPDFDRYLREQFAHTGDAAVVVDAKQRILLWNQAATVLLGYRSDEVLGKLCYEVMKTRDCQGAAPCCQNCLSIELARKRQWASHQTLLAETKTGKPICLSVASFCLLSSERKFVSLAHVFWKAENATGETTEAVDASRSVPLNSMEVSPLLFLTSQERHVLRCLAAGMDTKAIGSMLFISPTTVRNHIESILHKLGVHSRLAAVALAHHHHWGITALSFFLTSTLGPYPIELL